ncbi:cyclic-di-AMP receptor [uncultured Clostridium sp.]|uniref:cyclic-di-AMP receptor n=1 Tax=uncultured Clostridium sp. TaxID=59620 RepID=UPI0026304B7A|nr:cyclic-di-AMP receptor [uncultured Clostridium sp.]
MKLIITIVQDDDSLDLVDELNEKGYTVTKLATTGGFLKSGNTTLLIGVEESRVDGAVAVIKENCERRKGVIQPIEAMPEPAGVFVPYPIDIEIGGATIFVVDVDKYFKF